MRWSIVTRPQNLLMTTMKHLEKNLETPHTIFFYVHLIHYDFFSSLYENVPKIFVPLFYFVQKVDLSDELASNLRVIQNLPEYFNYTVLILVGLGSVCTLWGLCSCFCCSTSKDKLKISEKIQMNTHYEEVPLNEKLWQ